MPSDSADAFASVQDVREQIDTLRAIYKTHTLKYSSIVATLVRVLSLGRSMNTGVRYSYQRTAGIAQRVAWTSASARLGLYAFTVM